MSDFAEQTTRVKVAFHKSSAKDGQTGFSVEASEGATADEAQRVFAIVAQLKAQADQIVAGKTVEEMLVESVGKVPYGMHELPPSLSTGLRRGPANGDPSTRTPRPSHG